MSVTEAPDRGWSLGPVLAEAFVDAHTYVLVIRRDGTGEARAQLWSRLLSLRDRGASTVVVDLAGAGRVSHGMLSTLRRADRMLAARNVRLLVDAPGAEARAALRAAGLELADLA